VDFLALLAYSASASGVVGAHAKGATVEPVFELLAVLRFPCFDWQAILLLDLVPLPLGDDVEAAEGDYTQVWGEVVDVASLQPLLVLIVFQELTIQDNRFKPTIVIPTSSPFLLLITTPS
jgi:hypothetical protein